MLDVIKSCMVKRPIQRARLMDFIVTEHEKFTGIIISPTLQPTKRSVEEEYPHKYLKGYFFPNYVSV